MAQPERRDSAAGKSQSVLAGAREEVNDTALDMMQNRRSGKLLLEVFFENGQAVSAQLQTKFACKN